MQMFIDGKLIGNSSGENTYTVEHNGSNEIDMKRAYGYSGTMKMSNFKLNNIDEMSHQMRVLCKKLSVNGKIYL